MSVTLRLNVIDEGGDPVEGAAVSTSNDVTAITDANGVAIVDIRTGFDSVHVVHARPADAQLVFSPGDGSSGLLERLVTLRRGAPLSGIVQTPDGTPAG